MALHYARCDVRRARGSAMETAGGSERVSDTAGTRRARGARDDG